MKFLSVALASALLAGPLMAETVNRYAVAHTRHRDANMVIVKIHPRFFDASLNQQERWYTDIQSCVRSVKLAGTVVIANDANNRFRYYGPKSWHNFLSTIDMKWVNARVNKEMTCHF